LCFLPIHCITYIHGVSFIKFFVLSGTNHVFLFSLFLVILSWILCKDYVFL
jgi:hypothetical protein